MCHFSNPQVDPWNTPLFGFGTQLDLEDLRCFPRERERERDKTLYTLHST